MSRMLNILLAYDNDDDVFLLREAFRKSAAESRLNVVVNGVEVMKYLKGEGTFSNRDHHPAPDVLLLDLNMPQMNGFEVLKWLKSDPEHQRLVAYILTASSRKEDIEHAYRLGANGYVVKPTRVDELIAMVAALHNWHRFTISTKPVKS